jgi:hypothetical protein
MLDAAVAAFQRILDRNPWTPELAGILPLSALIDFIEIPPKLHAFQLVGAAPLWSWPITPAGSRLLLSDDEALQQRCFLDRHGNSITLHGLDGLYGAAYVVANPETLRLCLSASPPRTIANLHANMQGDNLRVQRLDVVHVLRLPLARPAPPSSSSLSSSWLRFVLLEHWRVYSARYLATAALGWVVLLAMIVMSAILRTYIALAFLVTVPATGAVLFALYGSSPRRLLVTKSTTVERYNRLILVAEHMNSTHWTAFYGESTILNSLINRPLEPAGLVIAPAARPVLRACLRVLILGQWAMALAAAATKNWNSYFICFWIAFCIFLHAYVITTHRSAEDWMRSCVGLRMQRYRTHLSSRRTLLNTIMALNPATFPLDLKTGQNDLFCFRKEALKWINPILEPGAGRTRWEEASLKAMREEREQSPKSPFPSDHWRREYGKDYWNPFILEGIEIAARIRLEAKLPDEIIH